jgi:tetratricopeptide (TPR) repeat protein
MTPHAFIAMPFGRKPGWDAAPIDFDAIRRDLLAPALLAAGYDEFRADDERRAGDIRFDMFQELLVADLVVVDLTLDNPNVWYELGVRHALRARGVVLVQGPRPVNPFDIYADRKLVYHLKDGVPDPAFLAADITALTAMLVATREASPARPVSPVYQLLEHLREPSWRDLLMSQRNEFSEVQQRWQDRMEIARRKGLPGDMLVLADETPTQALRVEARRFAGDALLKLRHAHFALEQYDAALALDPENKACRQKRVVALGRTGRVEEARQAAEALTRDYPRDPECWALAGRVEKDEWIGRWRADGLSSAQMREAAAADMAVLEDAIEPYHQAFLADPSHHYSGVNSLTLHLLLRHLGGDVSETLVQNLTGGVLWAALSAQHRDKKDYWARASYAELCMLVNPKDAVVREYRNAVAAANKDWFALDSTRQTLTLLRDLEFRPEETGAALEVVDREIARLAPPFVPRQVLLFSGHMVDAPGRPTPRFPAAMVPQAGAAIERALEALGAGAGDLALTQGAAGGDLLFAEACAARGVRVQLLQPLPEAAFIAESVLRSAGGEAWRERYFALKSRLAGPPRCAGEELGEPPRGTDVWERGNLWLLYTGLAFGFDKLRCILLWDGGGSDGPGGTRHMKEEVEKRAGRVTWLDTRDLGGT